MAYGVVHRFTGGTKEQYEASLAVVHPNVTDTQLVAMGKGGICGLRFTLHDPRTAVGQRAAWQHWP